MGKRIRWNDRREEEEKEKCNNTGIRNQKWKKRVAVREILNKIRIKVEVREIK